jgi:NAD(P) transhydrogenase subunit alpha
MLMTAAGTLKPAKVLVIGAGVAGLQAIATARRLGAVVLAYDVRPAVKEQIESLGAKFVELKLDTADAEDQGGYAKALDEDQQQRQREQLADVVAECDACISTAAIPGRPSPLLITANAVERMATGSVIVDLAAERGGNCELTKADEVVLEHGVTILGPTNLASDVPQHASQMYSKNLVTLLQLLIKEGQVDIDFKDEIIRDTLAAKDGQVQNPRLRDMLNLGPLTLPEAAPPADHLAGDGG